MAIELISRDLACPRCEYNLRGLSGAIINCPECGFTCDTDRMVAMRWNDPSLKAPGLLVICLPAAWAAVVGMLCGYLAFTLPKEMRPVLLILYLGGWIAFLVLAWSRLRAVEAIHLALIAHALVAGYLVAIAANFVGVVGLMEACLADTPEWFAARAIGFAAMIFGSLALAYFVHRAEKLIARRYIRFQLNHPNS